MPKSGLPKILSLLFFITLTLGGLFCQKAMAYTASVNADGISVRSGPGFSYDAIATLAKDTGVSVLQSKSGWSQIEWQQVNGWVADMYLDSKENGILQTTLQVTAESANLRSGAGTGYPKVGEAKRGDIFFLVKKEGDWCEVKTPQGLVYINASLVQNVSTTPATLSVSRSSTSANNTVSNAAPIKVYVNGTLMSFDVNPVIENGRTLVPMSAIFKAMGASVSWNGTNQTVTASKGTSTVSLTIGATTALVDGKVKMLDVPAKIISGRTLVPLGFVGSAYGGRVAWDPDRRQVEVFCPPNPSDSLYAIVIDEDSVNLRASAATSAAVVTTSTRGQQFAINAEENGWYQVTYFGTRAWVAGWLISPVWSSGSSSTSTPSGSSDTTAEPSGTTTQPSGSNNQPSGSTTANNNPVVSTGKELLISYSKGNLGVNLVITHPTTSKVQINEGAGSITYNFSDCSLKNAYSAREDLNGASLTIIGQNVGQGVQVQVSMPAGMAYKKTSGAASQNLRIFNCITAVSRSTFNISGENIVVKTAFGHSYTQQQSGNTMVICLPGVAKGLAQSSYNYSSQSLQSMSIAQQLDASGVPTTVITILTKAAAKFSIGSTDDDQVLHVLFINTKDIPPRNSVVVLDPGHGGSEAGSCGDYTKEKDINLSIALKVGAILTQKGIRVEYTRKTDSTVGLSDRGPIANLLNAALFVSIHSNAVDNSDAQGTETWFWAPSSNPSLYIQKDEREKLATAIQDRLAAALGRLNRGVKSYQNLCVLRTSEMPSALAEVAFLSNPEEERLLNQDSFQNLAARAIAEGIAACMPKK
ncbi:MAG: N-acetylmuramoyl-L-alanine amidase [Syntrophomonas sp.]